MEIEAGQCRRYFWEEWTSQNFRTGEEKQWFLGQLYWHHWERVRNAGPPGTQSGSSRGMHCSLRGFGLACILTSLSDSGSGLSSVLELESELKPLFSFGGYWGFNLGPGTCWTGTLPLEPCPILFCFSCFSERASCCLLRVSLGS
jgi:hypothetical protein